MRWEPRPGMSCKDYADLRVAAGPTHAGFTAGVRWIGEYPAIRRGRSRGVLLHCQASVQNCSIGAAANSETAGDSGGAREGRPRQS